MEYLHVQYLVVLAPALFSAAMGLVVNGPVMGKYLRAILSCREHVATLQDGVMNIAFLGSACGAIFGYGADSREAYLLGGLVALAALFAVSRLSKLAAELASADGKAGHRKMAGTVRSIIRSELAAAAQPKRGRRPLATRSSRNTAPSCCSGCQCTADTPLKVWRTMHRMKGKYR